MPRAKRPDRGGGVRPETLAFADRPGDRATRFGSPRRLPRNSPHAALPGLRTDGDREAREAPLTMTGTPAFPSDCPREVGFSGGSEGRVQRVTRFVTVGEFRPSSAAPRMRGSGTGPSRSVRIQPVRGNHGPPDFSRRRLFHAAPPSFRPFGQPENCFRISSASEYL